MTSHDRREFADFIQSNAQEGKVSASVYNPSQLYMLQRNGVSSTQSVPRIGDLDSDTQLCLLRDRIRAKAVASMEQEDYRSAVACSLESIRLCEQLQRASPAETLPESLLLSKAYTNLGEPEEARYYLKEACAMAKYQPYQDPIMNASLYSIIAEQFMLQGDATSAQLNYSLYCSRIESTFGLDHVATSDCYNVLASFHTHRGQYSMALEYCTRALSIRISQLGHHHRCTADSHYNLGLLHRLHGNPYDAKREFNLACDIRTKLFGAQSLEVAEVAISIGFTNHQLNNLEGAHKQYEKAFLIRALLLGALHPDAVEALNLLQAVRASLGRPPYEYSPGKEKVNAILASAASHSRHRAGPKSGSQRSSRVEALVSDMDRRREPGSRAAQRRDKHDFSAVQRAIKSVNQQAGPGISPALENTILMALHSGGPLSAAELQSRFASASPTGLQALVASLGPQSAARQPELRIAPADQPSARLPAFTPVKTNVPVFTFPDDSGESEVSRRQLEACIDLVQAQARLGGQPLDPAALEANRAILRSVQSLGGERVSVAELSDLLAPGHLGQLRSLIAQLRAQLAPQTGGPAGPGDAPGAASGRNQREGAGRAGHEGADGAECAPPPPGPPPVAAREPAMDPENRTKTVGLSGGELWKLFDKKVTALGVVPMLVQKEKDRVALEQHRLAIKRRKEEEAKKREQAGTVKLAKPPPRKGTAVTKKKPAPSGPKSDLKRIHWDVLETTEGTIWDDVDVDVPLEDVFGDLKTAFSSKPANGKGDSEKEQKSDKPKEVVLVPDPKRRQNMSIFVKTLTKGGRTLADVSDLVLNMDAETLGPNALASFAEFAPAEEEVSLVESYVANGGDISLMGPAEKFILEMSRVNRLHARITSMRFKATFMETVRDLEKDTDVILRSCSQVRNSTRLSRLLGIVLKLGNELNKGTYKGGATGIRLSSLMKLTQTKTNRNVTMLEYLITNLWDRESDILKLKEDFLDLDSAAKCNLQTMTAELGKLRVGIRQIDNTVKSAGDDTLYVDVMQEFLDRGQMVFEALEEKFQEMKNEYAQLCRYFGEDPLKIAPDEYFGLLRNFIGVFSAACNKIEEAREREERQQKREAERKAMLEKRPKKHSPTGNSIAKGKQLIDENVETKS